MLKHYAIRLLLSFVVLFVTLEIGLQVASLVLPTFLARGDDGQTHAGDLTILCVGDSHTFGAALPPQNSYPAQLKERLDAARTHGRVRVVNLGIPGQNSAMVANRLEGQIKHYQPDLVIVWVGLNNSWNFNEFDLDRVDDPFIEWRQWLLRSKVLRLIIVSEFRETGGRPALATESEAEPTRSGVRQWSLGGEVIEIPKLPKAADSRTLDSIQAQRRNDYARMIDTTRTHEVPLIFITYPVKFLPNQRATNNAIRSSVKDHGVSVVASYDAYREAIKDGHRDTELIIDAVGPHPTRLLYRYVVDSLLPIVDRLLARS